MNRGRAFCLGVGVSLSLAACGEQHLTSEDYGNLLASPSGLVLEETEHPEGWGEAECTICHNLNNIHREDRSGLGIDVAAIRDITFTEGLSSCADCHGANGVP